MKSNCNIVYCEYCFAMFVGQLYLEKHQKTCPKKDEKSIKELKFIIAAEKGEIDKLEEYLREGVDINCSDGHGSTPLTGACSKGKLESVQFLLEHGVDINEVGGGGYTCLHEACFSENIDLVKYLLENGVDKEVLNWRKEKAYEITKNEEIRELIKQYKN